MAILDLRTPQDWPDGLGPSSRKPPRRSDGIASGLYDDESDEDWEDPDDEEVDQRPYSCDLPSQNPDISEDVKARLRAPSRASTSSPTTPTGSSPTRTKPTAPASLHVLSHQMIDEKLRRAAEVYGDVLSADDVTLLRRPARSPGAV